MFKTYCIRDVAVEMQIRKKLQKFPIPDKEQELYCMDQRINDRGILVDRELITHAAACDLLYKEAASKRAYKRTNAQMERLLSKIPPEVLVEIQKPNRNKSKER